MDQIPEAAWNALVDARQHAAPRAFSKELGEQPTLLIFLRHLG
ncbi:MAG: hypothetical protein ACI89X_002748 [Planctomycetota bacterium]|jgi:hypothetical protein